MSHSRKDHFLMILSRIVFSIMDEKWTLQLSDRYCYSFEEWFARCKNTEHEYASFALCTASPYVCRIYCTMQEYTGANIRGERPYIERSNGDKIAAETSYASINFNLSNTIYNVVVKKLT